jgi:molybdopterin molybdotransferase
MCDVIISTGGVSVGDYDLVPEAMLQAGYEVFVRGVDIKPGMACAYGVKGDRLMLALSGNPASALTNLECVCLPALKKMAGFTEYQHTAIKMTLEDELQKGANGIRFVRGRLEYEDGRTVLKASSEQGNTVISSAIGTNAYGIIKDRQGPIPAGTLLDGFVLQ